MRPLSRKYRFTVASSAVSSSPARATTISPSRASWARRTTTMSPSRMPASIIESPLTRSRKSPRRVSGTAISSSTFSSASRGPPAAIWPSSGSLGNSATAVWTLFSRPTSSSALGLVGSRRSSPARSRFARWAWTVDGEARPTAPPISRTVGGYPCRST